MDEAFWQRAAARCKGRDHGPMGEACENCQWFQRIADARSEGERTGRANAFEEAARYVERWVSQPGHVLAMDLRAKAKEEANKALREKVPL